MSNTSQLKDQLLKSMTDEQLANHIINIQMLSAIVSDLDKTRIIKEVIERVHTTNPVILALQDKIVERAHYYANKD